MKITLPALSWSTRERATDGAERKDTGRRGRRAGEIPPTPLQLPASVWVSLPSGGEVRGTFVWADNPQGDCREKVRGHRAAYIFIFPDPEGGQHVFARPTSAEQYVRGNRTGKGWTQIRCRSEDGVERRLSDYRNASGFLNPVDMTPESADKLLTRARLTRVTEPTYTIGQIALALVISHIAVDDEKYLAFVEALRSRKQL